MKRNQKTQADRIQKEKFIRVQFPVLTPKNENQRKLVEALKMTSLVVAHGSAGTGKTILACYHAAKKLHYGDIKKIILIRAYQPLAGRSIGFLPGTAEEKLLPYYQQMIDYLEDCLGKGTVEVALKTRTVEICSLETIRGRSWDNTIVVVDEAQNLFPPEMQALMTRMGENCQMIICGDKSQNDQKNGAITGIEYLERLVSRYNISDTEFIRFTSDDVIRSGMTKEFVIALDKEVDLSFTNRDILSESKTHETRKGANDKARK